MEAANFDRTLNAFKRRSPFRPFTVALVNGDRFEVDYPDALVVRDGVAIYIGPGGVPVIFDHEGIRQVIGDLKDPANPEWLARCSGACRDGDSEAVVGVAPGSQLTWAGLSGGLSEEDWMDRRSFAEREGPVQTVVELHVRIDAQAVINGRGQVGGRRR